MPSFADRNSPPRILFVCTGNSARSQMAEGFARHLGFDAHSSGTEPAAVLNPNAVVAMAEKDIEIGGQTPKVYDQETAETMDVVVTVCGDAEERCPVLPPSVRRIHWPLPDPARATGSPDDVLTVFRRVRDDIEQRIYVLKQEMESR